MVLKLGQYLGPFRTGLSAWWSPEQAAMAQSIHWILKSCRRPPLSKRLGEATESHSNQCIPKAEATTENLSEVSAWESIAGAAFHGNEFI